MSTKRALYYTKGKHSQEFRVGKDRELPELRQTFIEAQKRIRPRDIAKTAEERIYRQIIQESLKPPSVKTAEAEDRKMRMEVEKAKAMRKEQNLEDIAQAARLFPESTAETRNLLERFLAQVAQPPAMAMGEGEASGEQTPSYESLFLSPGEKRRSFFPEEIDIQTDLVNASTTQPLSKNLNNLFNTPRGKTTSGIKLVNKLSADGLRKALKNADDNGRSLDPEFKRAIRAIMKEKSGR